ncbi:MAG TPA: helix-turn-helix domain-containing protein [Candidatus Limnocylindrales bacterium]|nr:helix-turn-helix domain-containing protein [Candidatus Limnocylindrales bacterium]
MKSRRAYTMTARAESAALTGERILDAAVELFWERPTDRLSLDDVASRADVSVQTVIRRFGGKEGLLVAAVEREGQRVGAQRGTAPVGDVPGAVRVLVDHYEEMGDAVLAMLAAEPQVPGLVPIIDRGREVHREWCRRVFAPALEGRSGVDRSRLLAQVVAVCDVHTWRLLRHDGRLSRRQVERALVELLEPLMEGSR